MKERILIIESDEKVRTILTDVLLSKDYEVIQARSSEEGMKKIYENELNLVLLDDVLPDINGIELSKKIIEVKPLLPVIMISENGIIKDELQVIETGVYDWLRTPLNKEDVLITVRNALEKQKLQKEFAALKEDTAYLKKVLLSQYKKEIIALKEETEKKYRMVGVSGTIRKIFDIIDEVAKPNASILVLGESGVGKELVARMIHNKSRRKDEPFIKLNCAAIPETLIESELFGYEKGAFTDAREQKKGKLEVADKGFLFLDEVGDMSLPAQAKLLRFLQEGEFERLGSNKIIKVNVRIVAATNKKLEKEIEEKRFREDLFYRLNVINIYIPPLRERKDDIPTMADYFLTVICDEQGVPKKSLTPDAIEYLKNQPWRGNGRELRNVMERSVILIKSAEINSNDVMKIQESEEKKYSHLMPDIQSLKKTLKQATEEFQKEYIIKALAENNWNKTKTAEYLNIERAYFHRKLKDLGINT
jgi:DNA-binding NtrC family response regulator